MEPEVSFDPVNIRVFGASGIMLHPNTRPDRIDQPQKRRRISKEIARCGRVSRNVAFHEIFGRPNDCSVIFRMKNQRFANGMVDSADSLSLLMAPIRVPTLSRRHTPLSSVLHIALQRRELPDGNEIRHAASARVACLTMVCFYRSKVHGRASVRPSPSCMAPSKPNGQGDVR